MIILGFYINLPGKSLNHLLSFRKFRNFWLIRPCPVLSLLCQRFISRHTCLRRRVYFQKGAHVMSKSVFSSMKLLRLFTLPSWDAIPLQSFPPLPPALNSAVLLFFHIVVRGTVSIKCPTLQHNTITPARMWIRTNRSRLHRANNWPVFREDNIFIFKDDYYSL